MDEYFEAQTVDAVTSDHTLARLEMPRMDAETLAATLSKVNNSKMLQYYNNHKIRVISDSPWMDPELWM